MSDRISSSTTLDIPWVMGLTIGQALAKTAKKYPDNDAAVFVSLGVRYTWREFLAAVDDAARGLLSMGIKKGEHVHVHNLKTKRW